MASVNQIYNPPPIPHKMDVIPIHTSDRATFKFCRRKWNWSSPMRENLRGKVNQVGADKNLWFGTGIHYALQKYYDPILQRDPIESFRTWFALTWEGGIVREDELELCYDPNPRVSPGEKVTQTDADGTVIWEGYEPTFYHVEGLRDLLPDIYNKEEFEAHKELGEKMLEFYRDQFAPEHDSFRVVVAEHQFSIPLGFEAIDPRDGEKKEVHYRGKQDAIIQDLETERYGILEHKTAASITEDYFRKLEKDEQVTSYMWSAEEEARIYDLEYKQIDFTLYNALRKTYPRPPTQLKSGLFSVDRSKESTTWPMLEAFIKEAGIEVVVAQDEKLSNYCDYVKESGFDQFVIRKFVTRNRSEVRSCEWRVKAEVEDMLAIPIGYSTKLYPNPTGDRYCLSCPFRGPCISYDDGSDFQTMLEDNYEKNLGR